MIFEAFPDDGAKSRWPFGKIELLKLNCYIFFGNLTIGEDFFKKSFKVLLSQLAIRTLVAKSEEETMSIRAA